MDYVGSQLLNFKLYNILFLLTLLHGCRPVFFRSEGSIENVISTYLTYFCSFRFSNKLLLTYLRIFSVSAALLKSLRSYLQP
jgi:hypothetical protein